MDSLLIMSKLDDFKQTMSKLGYRFEEQDGQKLTFRKNARYSDLVLVIDLGSKYINPISIPKSIILHQNDIQGLLYEFLELREDAKALHEKSNKQWRVLN
jgi:hypothetical protein